MSVASSQLVIVKAKLIIAFQCSIIVKNKLINASQLLMIAEVELHFLDEFYRKQYIALSLSKKIIAAS